MKTFTKILSIAILTAAAGSFTGCISVHRDEPVRTTTTTTTAPVTPGTTVQRTTTVY